MSLPILPIEFQSLPILPVELQLEIFSYLPCKSVMRLMVLSRLHRSHFTSPLFISQHYSKRRSTFLLLLPSFVLSLRLDDNNLNLHHDLRYRFLEVNEGYDNDILCVIGVYEGLICVETTFLIFLINPAIRRYVSLGPADEQTNEHIYCYGFINRGLSDYLILKIDVETQLFNPKEISQNCGAWVLTLKHRYWKRIETPTCTLCIAMSCPRSGIVYNGLLHWGAKKWVENSWHYFIMTFWVNDENEGFGELLLPDSLAAPGTDDNKGIFVVGGCNTKPLTVYAVIPSLYTCAVWVMNEYGVMESWTPLLTFNFTSNNVLSQLFGFNLDIDIKVTRMPFLLFHRNNGQLLFQVQLNEEDSLRSLDVINGTFTVLPIDVDQEFGATYAGYYTASLVPLDTPV